MTVVKFCESSFATSLYILQGQPSKQPRRAEMGLLWRGGGGWGRVVAEARFFLTEGEGASPGNLDLIKNKKISF